MKVRFMSRKKFFCRWHTKALQTSLLLVCLSAALTSQAQVRIGVPLEPHRGAVLQMGTSPTLDVTDTLGMKLTVVSLPDTTRLYLGTPSADPASMYQRDYDLPATGMVVYNITEEPCSGMVRCLYVWTGGNWVPLGCSIPPCELHIGSVECPYLPSPSPINRKEEKQ